MKKSLSAFTIRWPSLAKLVRRSCPSVWWLLQRVPNSRHWTHLHRRTCNSACLLWSARVTGSLNCPSYESSETVQKECACRKSMQTTQLSIR